MWCPSLLAILCFMNSLYHPFLEQLKGSPGSYFNLNPDLCTLTYAQVTSLNPGAALPCQSKGTLSHHKSLLKPIENKNSRSCWKALTFIFSVGSLLTGATNLAASSWNSRTKCFLVSLNPWFHSPLPNLNSFENTQAITNVSKHLFLVQHCSLWVNDIW